MQYFIQKIKQQIQTKYLSKGDIYGLSGEDSVTRKVSFQYELHWVPCV